MIDNVDSRTQQQSPVDGAGGVVNSYAHSVQAAKIRYGFKPFGLPDDGRGYLWQRSAPPLYPVGSHPSILPATLFDLIDGFFGSSQDGRVKWFDTEELANEAYQRALLKLKGGA